MYIPIFSGVLQGFNFYFFRYWWNNLQAAGVEIEIIFAVFEGVLLPAARIYAGRASVCLPLRMPGLNCVVGTIVWLLPGCCANFEGSEV